MARDFSTITVEDWLRGPLHIVDSPAAHANKRVLDAHLQAEWSGDLDATMRTMHPDEPWQIVHGLDIDVRGFDEVRDYYAARIDVLPGPGMEYFTRATIGDTCAVLEFLLKIEPDGEFAGHDARGRHIEVPTVIVFDFRDGLVLGETCYLDSALAREQLGIGVRAS